MKSPLLRYLAWNLLLGAGAAVAFVVALIAFDLGGFRSLIVASGTPVLATVMLLVALVITWGSAAMGTAIFLLPKDDEEEGGSRRQSGTWPATMTNAPGLQPVPIKNWNR
ncbi:MAG: hypothetical protein AAFR03_05565 [Pseudomonadota bacterium]